MAKVKVDKVEKKAPKIEKTPKIKKLKVKLVITAPEGTSVKETKFLSVVTSDADKKKRAWLRGSTLGLTEVIPGNKILKSVSDEDATKKHLGKTRMIGRVTQEELNDIITKFFS